MGEWVGLFKGWFLRLGQKWFYVLGARSEHFDCNTILDSLQGDQEWQRTSQQERSAHSQGGRHFRGKFVCLGTPSITSPTLNLSELFASVCLDVF